MQLRSFFAAGVAFVIAVGGAISQTSGETNFAVIDMDDVPQAVLDTASRATGDVELIDAFRELSRGRVVYELSGCTTEGAKIEVGVYEDGTLQEVQREIAIDDLPRKMLDVARANVPNFQPSMVMASERDGPVLSYDMEGEADGSRYGVEVWTNLGNVRVEPSPAEGSLDNESRCNLGV